MEFWSRSSMIKSVKDGEQEVEGSPNSNWFTTWEIFPIYRAWFTNLLLSLEKKSLNFRDKIFSFLSRINLPRNKGFRNREIY